MSEISSFAGISIHIRNCKDGPPHFHAHYQDFQVAVEIENGIMTGRFPPQQLALIQKWLESHRQELLENWNIAAHLSALKRIEPLT